MPHVTLHFAPSIHIRPRVTEPPTFTLESENTTLPSSEIDVETWIFDTSVWRGRCRDEQRTPVVLKFPNPSGRLEVEERAYERMADLQGSVIPRFYGLWRGRSISGYATACMILECFGDYLKTPYRLLPPEDRCVTHIYTRSNMLNCVNCRAQILSKLQTIHERGLSHPEIYEGIVLKLGNDFRLFKFHEYEKHECRHSYDFLKPDATLLSSENDPHSTACPVIFTAADDMRFWTDGECTCCSILPS